MKKEMEIKGIYRYNTLDEEEGKPHIVAAMISPYEGMSLPGGAMAPFGKLTFGEQPSETAFYPEQWTKLTAEEYENWIKQQIPEVAKEMGKRAG